MYTLRDALAHVIVIVHNFIRSGLDIRIEGHTFDLSMQFRSQKNAHRMGRYSKNFPLLKGSGSNYTEWRSHILSELASEKLLATLNEDYCEGAVKNVSRN